MAKLNFCLGGTFPLFSPSYHQAPPGGLERGDFPVGGWLLSHRCSKRDPRTQLEVWGAGWVMVGAEYPESKMRRLSQWFNGAERHADILLVARRGLCAGRAEGLWCP